MREEDPPQDEDGSENGESRARRPSMRGKQERAEGRDRTKNDAAQRCTKSCQLRLRRRLFDKFSIEDPRLHIAGEMRTTRMQAGARPRRPELRCFRRPDASIARRHLFNPTLAPSILDHKAIRRHGPLNSVVDVVAGTDKVPSLAAGGTAVVASAI
jgi:hypothetical protein